MFNSNYSVSPNAPQHSRFHYDETPAPEERSASNRYQDEYEQGGDRYYQQHQKHSQHSYSDRHSPPSRPSRDDRAALSSSSSSLQPSGSLRRKSQQDWARPRGTSGSSLRPDPQPTQRPRTPVDENSAVLERMRAGGWMGVGQGSSSGHGEDEGYATSFHGSMDSGYGSGYGGEEGKGGGLGSWSALKKAVGFGDEDAHASGYSTPIAAPKSAQGSHYWDKLTAKLATTVSQLTDEDDSKVGEDGETKLGRAIREYHFSRALSVEDIPEWLFTPAELAARRNRRQTPPSPSSRRRSVFRSRHDDGEPSMAAVRSAGRKASRVPLTREGGSGMSARTKMESVDEGPTGTGVRAGSSGGGRAADKLRAMREAKRVR